MRKNNFFINSKVFIFAEINFMSKAVLIEGASGSGKSHSIQYLNPKSTFIINVLGKDLPWKGSEQQYTPFSNKNPKGNLINTDKTSDIVKALKYISEKRPDIKDIVIDDHTHIYAGYYLNAEAKEEGEIKNGEKPNIYRKFTHIAQYTKRIADTAKSLRNDLIVYILHHTDEVGDEITNDRKIKAASFGRFTEEKLKGIESQFTVVLLAGKRFDDDNKIKGYFKTIDVISTAKSPNGMFEEDEIDNNLLLVKKAMNCYYNNDCK